MSVEITGRYLEGKRIELTHGPSGATLLTVLPKDNHGDGSSFSPTDLAAASLASCMLITIALVAERDGIQLQGSHVHIEKHMQTEPRRIARLPVQIHLPQGLADNVRAKLERTALTCPVHRSLHPDVEIPIEFYYDVTSE